MPTYEDVAGAADAIEAAMREAGFWTAESPPPEAFEFEQAFAMDTMGFLTWLQWVFLPRVRQIIDERGEFPPSSSVAAQAAREFRGDWQGDNLLDALGKFDRLF